jgi:hypothetical protein
MQLCDQFLSPAPLERAGDSLAMITCLNLIIGIGPELYKSLWSAFYYTRNKFILRKWCKTVKKVKVSKFLTRQEKTRLFFEDCLEKENMSDLKNL